MSGSIYYGETKYDVPDFGDKLRDPRTDAEQLYDTKMSAIAEQEMKDQLAAQELQKARDTYNALSPQGPAWSPNDSQFYNPDDVPLSIDTALAPKPPMILVVIVFGLAIYFLKGK